MISLGRMLFWSFSDQREAKFAQNEVYQVSWKITTQNFSDFLYHVTVEYKPKIDQNDFFGKNLVLKFLGPEVPETSVKRDF